MWPVIESLSPGPLSLLSVCGGGYVEQYVVPSPGPDRFALSGGFCCAVLTGGHIVVLFGGWVVGVSGVRLPLAT